MSDDEDDNKALGAQTLTATATGPAIYGHGQSLQAQEQGAITSGVAQLNALPDSSPPLTTLEDDYLM